MHHKPKPLTPYYFDEKDFPTAEDTLEKYIRHLCHKKKISLTKLCELSGVNRSSLYRMFEPNSNPSIPDLLKIANQLGVHHYYLFRLKWREFDSIAPIDGTRKQGTDFCVENKDACAFIDETVPDGTLVMIGTTFEKTWTIQNVGDTVWENRFYMNLDAPYHQTSLVEGRHPDGLPLSDHLLVPHDSVIALPIIKPSETFTLRVKYTAPNVAGRYISYWRMVDETGAFCFSRGLGLSVSVLVRSFGVGVN